MSNKYKSFDREQFDRTEIHIPHHIYIKVIGVGSGGINAVEGMLPKLKDIGSWKIGFLAIDTDIETLEKTTIPNRLTLGDKSEWHEAIACAIEEAHLVIVYIVGGMGGEQGIDAMIEVAQVSKEMGALTISVVTRPFSFEGVERCTRATIGIEQLVSQVDTLIAIANDKLLPESDNLILSQSAFALVDNILLDAVSCLTSIVQIPGMVHVDFADTRSVLADAGLAYFGIGKGEGESRAKDSALQAINSPLLEGSIEGARGIVMTITGGADMSLCELTTAADTIYEVVDPNANIIFGAVIDENMEGKMQVSMIVTGFADPI
jgi:cell division protein FtsZ